MVLGINGRSFGDRGGTALYTMMVTEGIARESSDEILLFVPRGLDNIPELIETVSYPSVHPVIDDHLTVPLLMMLYGVETGFFPKNVVPLLSSFNCVVTVHDLGYFRSEEYYPLIDRLYQQLMISFSARKADKIIAISEETREDMINFTCVGKEKIRVVEHGIEKFSPEAPDERFEQEKALADELGKFIYCGRIGKRKGIEKFEAVLEALESEDLPHKLVFTGERKNLVPRDLEESEKVILAGYVDRKELKKIYFYAEAFISLSSFEGFGFQPFEALQFETPVVMLKGSGQAEKVIQGEYIFGESELDLLIDTLIDILKDGDYLFPGNSMERYSWGKNVEKHLKVLKEVGK